MRVTLHPHWFRRSIIVVSATTVPVGLILVIQLVRVFVVFLFGMLISISDPFSIYSPA